MLLIASTNSHTWAKIYKKRDRFLGKFKKDPPRIGEYDKNDILRKSNRSSAFNQAHPSQYKNIIKIAY